MAIRGVGGAVVVCWLAIPVWQAYAQSGMLTLATGDYISAFATVPHWAAPYVNPAMVVRPEVEEANFSGEALELVATFRSQALTPSQLLQSVFNVSATTIGVDEKRQFADKYRNAITTFDIRVGWLSLAYSHNGRWGAGVAVEEVVSSFAKFDEFSARLAFLGYRDSYFDTLIVVDGDTAGVSYNPKKFSEAFTDTRLEWTWQRHWIVAGAYCLPLEGVAVNVGVALRYVQGYIFARGVANKGTFEAVTANTPVIPIDYSRIKGEGQLDTSGRLVPVGSGIGFDVGVAVQALEGNLRVGASLQRLGSVKWNKNVLEADDTPIDTLRKFDGFNSFNIYKEAHRIAGEGVLQYHVRQSYRAPLPAQVALSAAYRINEMFTGALTFALPVVDAPGNLHLPEVRLGGMVRAGALLVSVGAGMGGNYGFSVPLGVELRLGEEGSYYSLGVATHDVLGWFTSSDGAISAGAGFIRVSF